MKKTMITLFTVVAAMTIAQAQFLHTEYTQASVWVDTGTFGNGGAPQIGADIQKIMRWGWISVSLSHYQALEPNYTDVVVSGGVNFHLFNFDPVRYYAGPRLGYITREGHWYPMAGGVAGFDWRISRPSAATKLHIGARLWIDYREDQKNQFYGDSDAYERGLVTNNPLLQENGAIVFSISW